ncbi:hypothetical protein J4035_14255 [Cellulomonas sp. zg-ZUI188]|uniref:DUF2238 domain-containing protein n=1 Tax=Cellulomonas fengjieae TaxID=2819978 RepID=A0ABS3SJ71_9CELL|nr:hypothetical protein [Cellulomonas fengjieae]QVI67853.1 hypothetical protein KG102_08025 [Cellulomonas fengjieae]
MTVLRAGWVPGDAVRAAALVSVFVGTWRSGFVATALFLLVLGGSLVPRLVGTSAGLDVAYCGTLLFAAWAAQLDWYVAVGWLDVVVHAVATGLIAVVALRALRVWGVVGPARSRGEDAVLVVGTGATLAALWELGEWAGNALLDPRIQVGYPDTMGDLAAGLAGAAVAAVLAGRRA